MGNYAQPWKHIFHDNWVVNKSSVSFYFITKVAKKNSRLIVCSRQNHSVTCKKSTGTWRKFTLPSSSYILIRLIDPRISIFNKNVIGTNTKNWAEVGGLFVRSLILFYLFKFKVIPDQQFYSYEFYLYQNIINICINSYLHLSLCQIESHI